jgi:hypothetical protein
MKTVFNKHLFFQSIFVVITTLLFDQVCLGQINTDIQSVKNNESFMNLIDGVIKREIAFFSIKASTSSGSFPKIKVNEIPLVYCKDSLAEFSEKGTRVFIFTTKFDTTGHKFRYIDSQKLHPIGIKNNPLWGSDGKVPKGKIKSIVYQHENYQKYLPDSAFSGLYEPNLYNKANEKQATIDCKVFRSEDGRRSYIYMLIGYKTGRHEVIWVIQRGKYYTRVIDPL